MPQISTPLNVVDLFASTSGTLAATATGTAALIASASGPGTTAVFIAARSAADAGSAGFRCTFTGFGALTNDGIFSWPATLLSLWSASIPLSAVALTGVTANVTVPPIYAVNLSVSNTDAANAVSYSVTCGIFGTQG